MGRASCSDSSIDVRRIGQRHTADVRAGCWLGVVEPLVTGVSDESSTDVIA